MSGKPTPITSLFSPDVQDFSHLHLLLVEDLPDNLELLKLDLQDQLPGVRMTEATDGVEALDILRHQDFSVVICDVLLPRMDGFEVLKQTRQLPDRAAIPFLFLSALNQEDAIKKGLALGAVDFVTKPYDEEILAYKVRNLAQFKLLQDELRATQRELEQINEFLEKLHEEKNAMLRLLSHDLRSPLSGIRGLAKILQTDEAANPKTVKEFAVLIENSIAKILPIIDELTFISHFSTAQPVKSQCDLTQLIQNALSLLDPILDRKKITVEQHLAQAVVFADCNKMLQMFNNVLLPIIEHTPSGNPIRVNIQPQNATEIRFWIEAPATDLAIDPEALAQPHTAVQHRSLSPSAMSFRLARLIAQLHHGDLAVFPDAHNFRVEIVLPIKPATSEQSPAA